MPIEAVLSDSNKRLLYDVGIYDSEDYSTELNRMHFLEGFGQGNSIADGFFPFRACIIVLPQLSGMGDFLGEMADMMSQATPTVKPAPAPAAEDLERPSRVEIRALTESFRIRAGDLRGAAAGVRGHVPGRSGRRRVLRRASDDGPQGPGTGQHLVAAVDVVVVAVAADACCCWKKQGCASTVVVVV